MKKLLLIVSILIVGFTSQAQAATVFGGALVESFTASTTGTASFRFTGGDRDPDTDELLFPDSYSASTDINFGSSSDSAGPDTSPVSASTISDPLFVFADAGSPSQEFGSTFAFSSVEVGAIGDAFANTLSNLTYELTGIGQVFLDFQVNVFTEVLDSLGNESASARISVSDGVNTDDLFLVNEFGDLSDTLRLVLSAEGFSNGSFTIESSAFASVPVPIPAAAWLLISGLVGIFGISRRKATAVA